MKRVLASLFIFLFLFGIFESVLQAQAYRLFSLKDDFGTSGTLSTMIGQLGWTRTDITTGGCANIEKYPGSWPNLGIARITTNTVPGNGCALSLGTSGSELLGNLAANPGWAAIFILRFESTSNVKFRVGFTDNPGNAAPSNGVWFRFDTASDTFITMETCSGGTCSTKVSTTIPSADRFMKFWIYSISAGQVLFNFDGREIAVPYALNANVPSSNMAPTIQIINNTNVAKNIQIDYFLYAHHVSR